MFQQHYEEMFATYGDANRQKLEQMLPQLITKYKESSDWGDSIVRSNLQHHRLEDSGYSLSRKYKRGIGWTDYAITDGDLHHILSPEERYTPLYREFAEQIEKDDALKDSGFPDDVVKSISQFY